MLRLLPLLVAFPLAAAAQPARVIPVQADASGRWGFRAEGDTVWVLAPQFDAVWPWPHDLVPGYTQVEQDGRRGLVAHGDGTARLVLPLDYDYVGHQGESGWHLFGRDSLVWVRQNRLEGFLDGRTWAPFFPELYEDLWGGGPYWAGLRGGVWTVFREARQGLRFERLDGVTFESLGPYTQQTRPPGPLVHPAAALGADRLTAKRDGRWALLNGRLEPLTPFAYDAIDYHYKLYQVRVGDGHGLIGRDGRVVLDPAYDEVEVLGPTRGLASDWRPEDHLRWARVRRGGRWALAGVWTGQASDFRFDWVYPFGDHGYAYPYLHASEGGRAGVIDAEAVADGEPGWLIPPRFDRVLDYDPAANEARVRLGDDRFWVDAEGRRIDRE